MVSSFYEKRKNHIDERLQDLEISFQELEQEYLCTFLSDKSNEVVLSSPFQKVETSMSTSPVEEKSLISQFLSTPCRVEKTAKDCSLSAKLSNPEKTSD